MVLRLKNDKTWLCALRYPHSLDQQVQNAELGDGVGDALVSDTCIIRYLLSPERLPLHTGRWVDLASIRRLDGNVIHSNHSLILRIFFPLGNKGGNDDYEEVIGRTLTYHSTRLEQIEMIYGMRI